jgi:hypothetical protein
MYLSDGKLGIVNVNEYADSRTKRISYMLFSMNTVVDAEAMGKEKHDE